MTSHLTPAELERLAILSEELGEVQQIIGKILRHGYESKNPLEENGKTNREKLEMEIGDVMCILHIMKNDYKDIDYRAIDDHAWNKRKKINKWLHHNKIN